ncbi:MAG: PAS domain-containing protein [candidate division Zixibacteria bacterium]|nr:PAS domain-containing protein [candidate division Zixibacteria bacterium]
MARRRMFWQLFPAFLLITLASVVAVAWYSTNELREFQLDDVANNLEARASLVQSQVLTAVLENRASDVDSVCDLLGAASETRITVILPSGEVLGDSEEDPSLMDDHSNRPEIKHALGGSVGSSIRFSRTIGETLMYVAIPLVSDGEIIGIVRTSIPITSVERTLGGIRRKIAFGCVVIAALIIVVSLIISRRISSPIERLTVGANYFAKGELQRKLRVDGSNEVHALAEAMNEMAADLHDRIQTVTRQRNEQEAILSSMSEGVIAFDSAERLLEMNHAAEYLIGVTNEKVRGRSFHEIVRNADLQQMVESVLAGEPVEGDIVLRIGGEKHLQVRGTALRDARGDRKGALIVLNDVSRIRRLENIRQDFVANVSHELRTPITSIKGFVETLLDQSPEDKDEVRRFLEIVRKHADRLNTIIEDLLSLSRIEEGAAESGLTLAKSSIREILAAAIHACAMQASSKDITIDLECSADLYVKADHALLEQAVINLIDNAIKYSDRGSGVNVIAAMSNDSIDISVMDRGIGIEEQHLSRVFERFYRVDKARSRDQGGTGLGLAIVKHIAIAHGGNVEIDSTLGEGTTCTIHLPILKT